MDLSVKGNLICGQSLLLECCFLLRTEPNLLKLIDIVVGVDHNKELLQLLNNILVVLLTHNIFRPLALQLFHISGTILPRPIKFTFQSCNSDILGLDIGLQFVDRLVLLQQVDDLVFRVDQVGELHHQLLVLLVTLLDGFFQGFVLFYHR